MMRYKTYAAVSKREDGRRKYETLRYPESEFRDTDVYIFGKSLMRLDLLAFQYYGDVTMWTKIAEANDLGKGSLVVPPGRRIRIPFPANIDEIQQAFFNANEMS